MESGLFQANELHTRKLETLSPTYTPPGKNYKSLIWQKYTMFQSNILSSVYIDKYSLIPGQSLIIICKI